jgi:predicted PurR-regulated permease PerM
MRAPADRDRGHVAYRAVLLAAVLVVAGLVFRQLVTLVIAVIITVILSIPLSAVATRLERHRVPRSVGAAAALLLAVGILSLLIALIIPPFVAEVNRLVEAIPGIVDSLRSRIHEVTGASSAEIGSRVQAFVRRFTERPLRLIGPIASVGLSVAGLIGAATLIVLTAYYIAIRPQPLVDGLIRLVAPPHRGRAIHALARIRTAWVGWLQGVAFDMLISGGLLYLGLRLIDLDFAVVFAVLTALLIVVPYFGAIAGAIPPVLLGLTDSPGRALVVLVVYVTVQQIEGNIIIPLIMARTVRLHPAVIAIGVVMVGGLFGFVGLLVAVPIISSIVILTEEVWIRPLEERAARAAEPDIELPATVDEPGLERAGSRP